MTYEKAKRKNEDFRPSFADSAAAGAVAAARFAGYFGLVLPAKGAWWLTKNAAKGSWWLTKNAGTYTWLGTKWAAQNAWGATRWTVLAPFHLLQWMFVEPMPDFENPRQAQAYKLVRRYYRRRQRFTTHGFIYVAGMIMLVINYIGQTQYLMGYESQKSHLAIAVIWTALIFFHFARVRISNTEDEALANVLERDYGQTERAAPQQYEYRGRLEDGYAEYADESVEYYEEARPVKQKR